MKLVGCLSCACLVVLIAYTSVSEGYTTTTQGKQKNNERLSGPINKDGISLANRTIRIVGDQFMLDGEPLQIVAGSMHYFRLPAVYWRDRLRKLKAAGLNAVTTYVEWSYHEPEERQYNFEGDRDVAKFIQAAAEEGLLVILRPGPYICAERDLGGLPYWLLGKYRNIKLRSSDADFMEESRIWLEKLFERLSPLLYENGGPIILVQIENEYGSYGSEMLYRVQMRDMFKQHVGTKALLFTTDGNSPTWIMNGATPDTLTTIDFGAKTNITNAFQDLRSFMPQGPLMNSEYYAGWLTHWGERFHTADAERIVDTLGKMLDLGASVNFYMFFGGSNFEYTAGANYVETYLPDITSYDYDSPLNEAGDPTPKYYMIRDKLKKYNRVDETVDPPQPSLKRAYGTVKVTHKVKLLGTKGRSSLGKRYEDVEGEKLPTFEQLRQRSGLMLYETTINEVAEGLLEILKPRDLIWVFVDGVFKGHISRMYNMYSIPISVKSGSQLSLLVENQGRINYGPYLNDPKGILSEVLFNGKILNGKWSITGYPLETFSTSEIVDQTGRPPGPTIFEGYFTLPQNQDTRDTFIDTTGWGKGYIWVNGYNLGRYWPGVGPQVTLYVPGVWLKPAPEQNFLQILELDKPSENLSLEFIDHAILNRTQPQIANIQ